MSTILIVDDRPTNRAFLMTLLGFTGHRLLQANDGAHALETVRAERPDLIITDILMPTMDGYEFVQQLRADPALAATRVIFYSATYALRETTAMARSCGVATVLTKPSDPQAIFDAVNIELGLSDTPPLSEPLREALEAPRLEAVLGGSIGGELLSAEQAIAELVARRAASPTLAQELAGLFHDRLAGLHSFAARLTALEAICLRLIGERSAEAMIARFLPGACEIMGADYLALCLLDTGEQSARHLAAHGFDRATIEDAAHDATRLPGALLREKQALRAHAFDGRVDGLPPRHPAVGTLLGQAVRDQNHLYGWIYWARKPGAAPFSHEDERIAATLGAQLAVAYENLNLYEVVQRHAAQLQLEATARQQADAALRESERRLVQAARMHDQQVDYLSSHDPLTRLPNRTVLHDRLQQAMAAARQGGEQIALLMFNVDRLQRINDSLGHEAGDALLREVARRAAPLAGPTDTLAHLGGDEFVLLLPQRDADDTIVAARRLIEEIAQPVRAGGHDLVVTASVGISIFPRDGDSPGDLLKAADVALSHMKDDGRNGFRFFKGEMNAHALRWITIETQLRRAIERKELMLHYQPQVMLADGRICGVEALLRWNSAELGLVPPGDFIELAEDTGMILPIGNWVIREACRQNKAWQDAGLAPLRLAVNVSAHQFMAGTVPAVVRAALEESGLAPRYLEVELTESVMMRDSEATEAQLAELRRMGVSISLDDFGTGYSSLGYLSRFTLDKLKIDQAFVRNITTEPRSAAIAQATIALAHGLSLMVVAEGVEDEGQLRFLEGIGCNAVQGYLFSRPLPAAELSALLGQDRPLLRPARE